MNNIINYFNKPILKVPMALGALAGLVCFTFFAIVINIEKISGTNRTLEIGFYLIFIATACWYYRKNIRKGYLHLWEGIAIGYTAWLTGALTAGYLTFGLFSFFPNMLVNYQNKLRNYLLANKVDAIKVWGKELFDKKIGEISDLTAASFIFDQLRFSFFFVVLGILIIALIFRKQNYGLLQP